MILSTMGWGGEELLNKVVIFVFFAHKSILLASMYGWTTDVTWTIFPMSLLRFWTWEHFSCVAVYGGSESSWILSKISYLCSEDERRSYRFGTTWGWVINDRIFIFGWTIPLMTLAYVQIEIIVYYLFNIAQWPRKVLSVQDSAIILKINNYFVFLIKMSAVWSYNRCRCNVTV